MNKSTNIATLVLSVALLACLLPMPYGYYVLVRFATMIIMVCLAFVAYQRGQMTWCVVAAAVALLFQPFVKIALGRDMWNIIDVILAVGLLVLCWKHRVNKK